MRQKSILGAVIFVVAILGVQTKQAAAQLSPGTFADPNNPSGPPDPQKEDQIWQVDPLTGALSVTIPFPTTPAGGRGPKIPFALKYNSSSTLTLQTSNTNIISDSGIPGDFAFECEATTIDGNAWREAPGSGSLSKPKGGSPRPSHLGTGD